MVPTRNILLLLIILSLTVYTGCGRSGPETVPVSGKVTFAGKPVTEGTIRFMSETDGTLASSALDAEGNYKLTTHPNYDGATLGSHKVTIRSARLVFAPDPAAKGKPERLIWFIPPRYDNQRKTPLTREVKPGPNVFDFDLPAEDLPE